MKTLWTFITLCLMIRCGFPVRTSPGAMPDVVFSEARCRFVFNEINTFSYDNQYLEISKYCMTTPRAPRPRDMSTFRILFINHIGHLVGMCHLQGTIKKRPKEQYWFYTVGSNKLSNLDMNIDDCQLPSNIPGRPRFREFPRGIIYPVGVALVYNERPDILKSLKLEPDGSNWKSVPIDVGMEGLIMRSIVDFYVYGAGTQFVYCKYFSKLYDGFERCENPILRDWQDEDAIDVSLSRCGTNNIELLTLPFQNQLWAYTAKTPGSKNNCKKGVRYNVEDLVTQKKKSRSDFVISSGNKFECTAITENEANLAGDIADSEDFQEGLDAAFKVADVSGVMEVPPGFRTEDTDEGLRVVNDFPAYDDEPLCEAASQVADEPIVTESNEDEDQDDTMDNENVVTPEDLESAFQTQPVPASEFNKLVQEGKPYIWDSCARFEDTSRIMRSLPGQPYEFPEMYQPNVCNWVELTKTNHLRCKLCRSLLQQNILIDRPKSKSITKIMTTGIGSLGDTRRLSTNKDHISNHLTSPMHKISVQFFQKIDDGLTTEEALKFITTTSGEYAEFYNKTSSMMMAAFQAVKIGLPFYKFKMYMESFDYYGMSFGHLHSNQMGMKKMVMAISDAIHSETIHYLLDQEPPISIIIDEVSDVSTKSVVAVLFQTVWVDKEIKVFLYKLIDLKGNLKGEHIFEKLVESIKQDGIENYIIHNLVGMSSDGGSNFRSTFRSKLKEYISNELLSIHCQCHVLERINYHAMKEFPFLSVIDEKTNEIFRLFNSRSPKRKAVLEYMILQENDSPFEVKRIQKIRWISSKLRALKNVIQHWTTILKAVRDIKNDAGSFNDATRLKAASIEEYLLDPIFLSTIAFSADVATVLTKISEKFQKRGFTPILLKSLREDLQANFLVMNGTHGEYLQSLLSRLRFSQTTQTEEALIDLPQVESDSLSLDGIPLNSPKLLPGHSLQQAFQNYLQALQDQISNYFPEGIEEEFAIFNPQSFEYMVRHDDFLFASIRELNDKLKWGFNGPDLCNNWKKLVSSLVTHREFKTQKENEPEKFWTFYLSTADDVGWTTMLQNVVTRVLSQPATSSEVERVFSLYAATKTLRRYSLKVSTVEAILRIRFNGPANMQDANADTYMRKFLKSYSRSDDKSRREKWTPMKMYQAVLDAGTTQRASQSSPIDISTDALVGDDSVDNK